MRTKNNRENQKNQKGDFLTTNKMGKCLVKIIMGKK